MTLRHLSLELLRAAVIFNAFRIFLLSRETLALVVLWIKYVRKQSSKVLFVTKAEDLNEFDSIGL